jgi:lytic murein transglycosylase
MQLVAAKARAQGVSEPAISTVLAGLQPSQRVIALDRDNTSSPNNAGFPPLEPYLSRHNTAARVAGGRRMYQQLGPLAAQVQQRYGVPAPIILAIWGHETSYGAVKGNFDLAQALATLAWEGRRRDLFEAELIDLMKMVQQGVPRSRLVGSWAGAFGNPQFLPSIYLRLAVDADRDGVRDIWDDRADTLYSIGNYFRDAGWRAGQPWGVRASIPVGLNRVALQTGMRAPI